ncbi:MAG: hypothetical protein K2O91_22930 [Lachnospiraceae bacterium]|nr:hypothetical protein [Lachnospiraceae bacterium]
MKIKKIAVYLCMGLLFATTSCSNSNADSDMSTVDTINFNDVIDTNAEENNSNNQNNKENDDNQQDSDNQNNSQGNNGESTNNESDNLVKNDDSQQNNNKDLAQQSNITQSQADSSQSQTDNAQLQSNSELDGNIESIGDNRVVINKTFHPSENTAVSYGDSGKVLVTVYFSEETEFEVWTVKNDGVNGDTDIEKRQGAFSDLEQGANINMTGNHDENDFHAKHVIIYNYV